MIGGAGLARHTTDRAVRHMTHCGVRLVLPRSGHGHQAASSWRSLSTGALTTAWFLTV